MSLSTVDVEPTLVPHEDPSIKGIQGRTPLQLMISRLRTDRVATASVVAIVLMVVLAIVAPLIAGITGDDQALSHDLDVDALHLQPRSIPSKRVRIFSILIRTSLRSFSCCRRSALNCFT